MSLDFNKLIFEDEEIQEGLNSINKLKKLEIDIIQAVDDLQKNKENNTIQLSIKLYWFFINYIEQLDLMHSIVVKLIRNYDKKTLLGMSIENNIQDTQSTEFFYSLYKLIELIKKLHVDNKMCIISDAVFKEEKENIQDFIEVEKRLNSVIYELKLTGHVEEIMSALIYIHLEILNYVWHIEQINELVKKIITYYDPTCIPTLSSDGNVTQH